MTNRDQRKVYWQRVHKLQDRLRKQGIEIKSQPVQNFLKHVPAAAALDGLPLKAAYERYLDMEMADRSTSNGATIMDLDAAGDATYQELMTVKEMISRCGGLERTRQLFGFFERLTS